MESWRPAAAAGLVGSAVVTGAMAIVHTVVPSIPFLPLALAQAVVKAAPAAQATDLSRRYLLRAVWWGALGVLVGAADLGRLLYRRPDPGRETLVLPDLMHVVRPPEASADRAFAQVAGLTPEVTSNESFYVVDEEIIDPDIDPDTWRLAVVGLVARPFRLSYEELKR